MLPFAKKLRDELGGGVLTSVALHLLVAALLFFQLPEWKTTPPEQESVKVEIVPPPKPEPQPKPEPEKKEEKVEPPKPQPAPAAPAAAAASSPRLLKLLPRSEEDGADSKAAPTADGTTEDSASTPKDSSVEQANTEAGPAALPIEAKPTVTDTPTPELQSAPTPSETAGQANQQSPVPTNAPQNMPTPQQKPVPTPKKTDQASKPNGSKSARSPDPFSNMRQKFLPNQMFDSRSAQIVARLSPEERLAALCASEALGRLSSNSSTASRDAMLPYGPAGGIISRTSFSGAGAAFRLGSNWYNLDYKCSVDAGATHVVSFTMKIGGLVPPNEWRARKLDNRR